MSTGANKSFRHHSQCKIIEVGVGRSHRKDGRKPMCKEMWTPYERKRIRGRPRKRCRNEIVEKAVNWMRRTGKRLGWKTMGRPPACSGMNG